MQLDKSKKYEFCGEMYEWDTGDQGWDSPNRGWSDTAFQFFADHGHVTEIREPLVFTGEAVFRADGSWRTIELPTGRNGKTFKVTWTEVVK